MAYTVKASVMSIARAGLGIVAAFLIENGLTDERTANDFVSNNVELVGGILLSVFTLVWIIAKNKFSNYAFWQAIFAQANADPEKVVDKAADESGLPKMLRF